MARKINWGPTNELMQRWTQYMMQDKLAKNRSERSMAQLREQMSGYEGLEDLRHEHDLYLAGVKNDFAKKAALANVLMDLDANPDFTALESSERVLRANGQTELADKKKAEYEGKKEALVKAVTQLYSGENLDETPIGSILGAGKFSETSGLLQSGMTRKSGIEQRATTERGQDVTMRGQDVTKRGQNITLLGQGGKTQKDYQDYIEGLKKEDITFLGKVLANPSDFGIDPGSGQAFEPDTVSAWKNLRRGKKFDEKLAAFNKEAEAEFLEGVISKKTIRGLMTQVNKIADKARTGKLSPDEENFLLSIQDLEGTLGIGETAPQPMTETPVMPTTEQAVAPVAPTVPEGELTPEESIPILAGMIMEKAKTAGIPMSLEAATVEARRQLGIR